MRHFPKSVLLMGIHDYVGKAGRIPDFPRCGHCFAQFIMKNARAPAPAVPLQIAAPMPAAAVIAAPMPAAAVLPLAL